MRRTTSVSTPSQPQAPDTLHSIFARAWLASISNLRSRNSYGSTAASQQRNSTLKTARKMANISPYRQSGVRAFVSAQVGAYAPHTTPSARGRVVSYRAAGLLNPSPLPTALTVTGNLLRLPIDPVVATAPAVGLQIALSTLRTVAKSPRSIFLEGYKNTSEQFNVEIC